MIVVGLTGGLASGKSAAAKFFKKFGAALYDADESARRAVRKGSPIYRAIVKIFGKEFLRADRSIDRKKLALRVFSNPADLRKLNILIHPGVIFECLKKIEAARKRPGILVLDIPLLFESRMEHLVDVTVVVSSRTENCLRRASRKGIGRGLAKKILSTQWSLPRKERLADFVVRNDGSPQALERKIGELFKKIQEKYPS
ncbi:MAG: dephospho-CoA kinase [Candidatus Omnitrophica bacterium]|nr:dephospho-CoA kinase [Candidatus Omnitrophota bacterium]